MDDILNHSKGQGGFLKQLQGLSLAKLLLMKDSLIEDYYSASIGRSYREEPMTNPPTSLGEAIKIQDNLNMAKEAFVRIAKRAHLNMLDSSDGQSILFDAFKHNIPFNPITVNFIELRNEIEKYEELLYEAELHCIEWDTKEYDPAALEQEIEYAQRQAYEEKNQYLNYFYATRGC